MYQSDVADKYKQNSVQTMRPEELTLTLYNGLVKNLMKAEFALTENDIEVTNNSLVKAQDILYEFVITLDMQYEVANGLSLLYDYMINRVAEANIKKDVEIVREVLKFAQDLRDTWQEAMKLSKGKVPDKEEKLAIAK